MKTRILKPMMAVLALISAAPLSAGTLFQENFETPDISGYQQGVTPPDRWVRAGQGFGSGDHGMVDKDSGHFSAPPGNDQAYAFRYSNSGITTAEDVLGPPLAAGGGYKVSFDVVRDDGGGAGKSYTVQLIAFGAGAVRDDCRSTPAGSTVLATATGNAPANGSIATVDLTFTPNATTHAAELGKDLGIRLKGATTSATIDNVTFRTIAGPNPGVSLVTTTPLDNELKARTYVPLLAVFSQGIVAGSGNITLRNLTNSIDTVIPVSSPRVTISGTLLQVQADDLLEWGKNYAILIDAGAIVQTPGGAPSFAGIASNTTWNFSTAAGDPLLYSASRLKDHINGVIALTPAEINAIKLDLDSVVTRYAESSTTITALLDLVQTYDTVLGPLWVSRSLPRRDSVTNDLHWTLFNIMQNIMDRIYTAQTLAAHEALLNGFKFGSSSNFPGACNPPANPANVHTATISASYLDTYGPPVLGDGPFTFARKPTGTYLAPGTIATVTVPPSLVGAGYKIRVGCHSWDYGNKPDIRRLDRVSRVYDITAASTKVANPLGGGIYIEVPFLANAGVVSVDITGAVRSPYFSAKSFHQTTPAEWLTERAHPAPWADFQSDKFMMQVPKSWISAMPDPTQLMADWDASMDAMNDLLGYPLINGKETMYPQVDLLIKNAVHAPGYPSVNTTYSPSGNYGGYANSHLVRGPQFAPYFEFHEKGHGFTFPKFSGESESTVNLLHVAIWNRKLGFSLDESLRMSMGDTNVNRTLDTTAMAWMCVFNFSPREVPMASGEKAYQLKGHAKFADIAKLYGWDVLGDFWGGMVDDEENNIPYTTDTDALLLRLCKAVGKDIRPLFHFWGIFPQNPAALASAIATEGIPADLVIRDRLLHYKSLCPANNAAFRTFASAWWGKQQPSIDGNWEEREHARQWDTEALYGVGDQQRSEATNPGEIYNENSANDITNRVQELVDLYFPGTIYPDPMYFASIPAAVNGTVIGMTAAIANASTGPVEYYFENTTNGNFRNWSTDPVWNNTGLTTGATYAFRVKARDGNAVPNETAWSATATATAENDTTPPSPDPMTFVSPPAAVGQDSITMAATVANDANGVEYQFECTSGGGNGSGWQSSSSFTDTSLQPSTQYGYRVRARDSLGNTTAWSASVLATTDAIPDTTAPLILSLSPANGGSTPDASANLVLTFNEPVVVGSGFITLKNLTDATQSQFSISDPAVTIVNDVLTINPAADLLLGKSYAIRIDANSVADTSNNPFVGITDDATWSFTTIRENPLAVAGGPYNVALTGSLSLNGSGSLPSSGATITLYEWDLDNNGTFGDVAGASPASVTYANLQTIWGMVVGKNTIKLRVTDSAAKTATVSTTVTLETPPVFADNFEAGTGGAIGVGGGGTTPDVTTYTVANTSGQANSTLWARATNGFGATSNGLIDESESSGANFTDPSGSQAYGFRYTNSGVTSAHNKIGALTAGTTITVSFDAVMDGWDSNGATAGGQGLSYEAGLVLFDGAGTRNTQNGDFNLNTAAVLKKATGSVAADGNYQKITFNYVVGDPVVDNNGATGGASTAWLSTLLGKDIALRFKGTTTCANIDNVSVTITGGGGGPGPLDHFAISPISSPQTVGTPITGITLTAQDSSDATVTDFTGTVTFGGTGGFSGTSASFVAGVLSGVSVTPTVEGSGLTLIVTDGVSGKTGTATIATIQTQYAAWANGEAFDADANGDGVKNGLAWLLGANNPNAPAALPTATQSGGNLILTFDCLSAANRGTAALNVQYSKDLGISDAWSVHTAAVPGVVDVPVTVNNVTFTTAANGSLIHIVATVPASAASPGTKLFGRLMGTP